MVLLYTLILVIIVIQITVGMGYVMDPGIPGSLIGFGDPGIRGSRIPYKRDPKETKVLYKTGTSAIR